MAPTNFLIPVIFSFFTSLPTLETKAFIATNVAQSSIPVAELHTRANVLSFHISAPRGFSPIRSKNETWQKSIRFENSGHREPLYRCENSVNPKRREVLVPSVHQFVSGKPHYCIAIFCLPSVRRALFVF